MKTIFLSAVAALALGTSAATAASLNDPITYEIAPAVDLSWTGAYAGITVNTDTNFDDATAGGFIGYRVDLGDAVLGGELNVFDSVGSDMGYSVETQLGYDLGSFLPYVSVGYLDNGVSDGEVFGIGLDYSFANDVLIGVKYTDNDFNGTDGNVTFRVGFQF